MTHNGSTLDGAGATGLYSTPRQQLPESSRSFEPFMTRATLDTLTGIDTIFAGRTEPAPGLAGTNTGSGNGNGSNSYSFPRPSYLEGSHYLARLEQQARQRALTQQESGSGSGSGAHGATAAANGSGGPYEGQASGGVKSPGNPSYLGIARDVVERTPAHEYGLPDEDTLVDALPTRWGPAKEDRAPGLEVLSDGLEVKYTGSRSPVDRDHEACAIRADKPMPLQCGLYYFEVKILSRRHAE